MCINIFRYITDNLKKSAMGLSYKIIEEYDFIEIMCTLIDLKPQFRINTKDQKIVYNNNKWEILSKNEFNRVNKTEAQLWLSVLNLFANEDIRKNYGITSKRKNSLMKLRRYLNESLTDQIPPLQHFHRAIEELSLTECPNS